MKLLLIPAVALLAGCTSMDKQYAAHLAAAQSIAQANALASQEKIKQIGEIARASADPSAKTAAVMAMAFIQTPQAHVPAPPESQALKWASILVPTLTNIATAGFSYRAGVVASNNSRDVTVAGYQAFGSMAAAGYNALQSTSTAGFNSNSAIAGFIQAPQANVTTTTNTTNNTDNRQTNNTTNNTTSSTANTTSNTTNTTTNNTTNTTTSTTNSNNRTCQGGSGATGGNGGSGTTTGGTGAPGGTGGSATC